MTTITATDAAKMTEENMTDYLENAGRNGPQTIEINAADPAEIDGLGTDGVWLEVIVLDENEATVRDRWDNYDADRVLVPIPDVYTIYHALFDQVNSELES